MKKIFYLGLFLFLLIPFVSANVALPFGLATLPLFPIILFCETIIFWILANKIFKLKAKFWSDSFFLIFVANAATSFLGMFIPVFSLSWIIIPFVLTVFVEFWIYLIFYRQKIIFKKESKKITKLNLFWMSLIVNTLSYIILVILLYFFM